jgi:hypothetical protein
MKKMPIYQFTKIGIGKNIGYIGPTKSSDLVKVFAPTIAKYCAKQP